MDGKQTGEQRESAESDGNRGSSTDGGTGGSRALLQRARNSQFAKWTGLRFQLLLFNAWPLFIVETAYSALSAIIVGPIAGIALRAIIASSGISMVTAQNLPELIFRPVTIVLIAALALCIAIYSLLDISAAIFTFHCSRAKKKVSVSDIMAFSIRNALRAAVPRNLPIVGVVLVLLPLMSMGVTSSFLPSVGLPLFVQDAIRSNALYAAVFIVVLVVLLVLSLRWNFSMHYFTIEQTDFKTAVKRSARLPRAHRIRNIVSMLVVQAALAAAGAIIIFAGKHLAILSAGLLDITTIPGSIVTTAVIFAFCLASCVLSVLGMPIGCLKISGTYYDLKEEAGEPIPELRFEPRPKRVRANRIVRWIACIVLGIFFAIMVLYVHALANNLVSVDSVVSEPVPVVAYRGDTQSNTENSIEAFESALQKGASGLVAEVQMSKDGVFFLASTSNLGSISNLYAYASEVDWSSIAEARVTATSFGHAGSGRFATLEELLELARDDNATVILEVDDIDCTVDAIARLLQTVDAYEMRSSCEFASADYAKLEALMSADSDVSTVYVAGYAVGSFDGFDATGAVALESLVIDADYVKSIHDSGKSVYAWGISDDETAEQAIFADVDALATGRVASTVELAERRGYDELSYLLLSALAES